MVIPQQSTAPVGSVPLALPYYGAPLTEAVKRFFTKYATFSGRASRAEYWWWALVNYVVLTVLSVIALVSGGGGTMSADGTVAAPSGGAVVVVVLISLYGLATIIPDLALTARRLHDGNFSALFIFIALVPFVGGLILLVLTLLPPKPEGARFDA
ncbi:DUF805 domain-containing protein [Cryobacterium sp. SO2]|uniref:DUF805 domain-containing protein n=1 Tax=Cryobacterium sp. SO2 TaxID=1897060 RepID=UPI00223CBA4E|nr:DUF805 domain-containing protein [Cryobacterium sp. SO2]WEO78386.1 DUF805 domain-containing protein [Cryobacterium sp. SO2]